MATHSDDLIEQTQRVARSTQALIGWIFWDAIAGGKYEALGVPGRLGYVGARAAPLAPAGDAAVIAAFYTIHPNIVRAGLGAVRKTTTFAAMWEARDEAVVEGLHAYVGDTACAQIATAAPLLWQAVGACEPAGRTLFAAHLDMPRPEDPLLLAWHGASNVREWRGDTHMALLVAEGLDAVEASLLHSAWQGYDHDWVARSRGWNDAEIAEGFRRLEARGLAAGALVNERAITLRDHIERRTDELASVPYAAIGVAATKAIADALEPYAAPLLARVDETAGRNYMPAARGRHPYG